MFVAVLIHEICIVSRLNGVFVGVSIFLVSWSLLMTQSRLKCEIIIIIEESENIIVSKYRSLVMRKRLNNDKI